MKLSIAATVLTAATIASAWAQDAKARSEMSLDGDWHYIVDPQLIGSKGYHDAPDSERDNMWFGRNIHAKRPSDLVEYNFGASPTLKVPGDWNTQKPELFYYEGAVWYERDFEWKKAPGRVFLHFDAVSLEAHVYLNGVKLGTHTGGFTPFEFEVTDTIREGRNSVVVRADNTRRGDGIPTKGFDWWNYGGIIRSVRLLTLPETYIARWRADLDKADGKTIHASVALDKPVKGVKVTFAIEELGLSAAGETDEAGEARLDVAAEAFTPWSPENPKRYRVSVTAGDDTDEDTMGFRTIATEGRKILLNGKEVFLRGVCLHDEAPWGGGRVTSEAEIAENIRRAKSLGCNFVRLAHYPHIEKMVRECEKAGLMVWSEIPLYWMIDWKNPRTYASAESQVREMISRDIRRANVVVWSLANETVPSKERNEFLARLGHFARELDSTRLISMAMEVAGAKNCVNRLHDALNTEVDIIAFNEYVGWYRNVADADKMTWEIPYEKPVVISEFGGGALARRHGARDERWTEEMQQNIYEANIRMFERIEGLAGTCPWVLTDFRSPRRPLAGVQDGYNRKGLFAPDGTEKLAAETMRRFYATKGAVGVAGAAGGGAEAEKAVCVSSPDGQLEVAVMTAGGKALYSVKYAGRTLLEPSRLGIVADIGDLASDLALESVRREDFTDSYSVPTIKSSSVEVNAKRMTAAFTNSAGRIAVEFHLSNNDVALRYHIEAKKGQKNPPRCIRVLDEATSFTFPEGTRAFVTPQAKPMTGWKRSKPSYEEEYLLDAALDVKSKYGCGWTFPALFREGESWVLLGETGVDSKYCASRLGEFSARTTKIEFPMPDENNSSGTIEPAMALPATTPWRTITMGESLGPIAETTIAWDVVSAKYEAKDYRYGRSAWSWILWQDNSMNFADQKKYIDLAAALDWEYVLVDAGWDKQTGRDKIPELVEYARGKGVGVFLWYNSCGWWNDVGYTPADTLDNPIKRKREMRWMKSLGVKGIKVDFWGGDKQETMRLYEQVLSDADDNDLMVIFHGCTLPRGWEKMYPNFVGAEAVLASENRYFREHFCKEAGKNASLHPFIRNTLATMEYGGTFLNEHMSRDNKSRHSRRTTVGFELATAVLFQNPIQNFALAPNNLADAPAEALEFMKKVPTTWDETRFLAGYPGKYAALARRHGSKWYVAAVAAEKVTLELDLTPLGGAKETVSLGANDGFVRTLGGD